jgi:hypothetical protein
MRNRIRFTFAALVIAVNAVSLAGCQKSSHATVHSYEYSDQGKAERPVQEGEVIREQPPSEYHMAAPGQMAAPGEMVPPGRPVVEPRRNP